MVFALIMGLYWSQVITGGVGSVVGVLAASGYRVAGVTGRADQHGDYLPSLGVHHVDRAEIAEVSEQPVSARWAGCIDSVGGAILARILGQLHYGGSVAAIGNAGGVAVPANVIPFCFAVWLLGIDSVMRPYEQRIAAWRGI